MPPVTGSRQWPDAESCGIAVAAYAGGVGPSSRAGAADSVTPSQAGVWRRDAAGIVVAEALPRTDLYIDPASHGSGAAVLVLNAATLLGTPPPGDFQFSARVSVDFVAQYDAGVLLVWSDERHWAKLCFEYSPANEPMVVSVVTREVSDDANAFTVGERSVSLRVSRVDHVYAFHASIDQRTWNLIRVFTLGEGTDRHAIGFEAQSPTGNGCTVTFDDVRFTSERLVDLRNGT